MAVWVAVIAAAGMTLLSVRQLAYAVVSSLSIGATARSSSVSRRSVPASRYQVLGRRQAQMMVIEIAFSIGITLVILGLTFTAAMPLSLMVGALLAQLAVVGALVAPVSTVDVANVSIRPAAVALGIAQLAHVAFFVRAIEALLS